MKLLLDTHVLLWAVAMPMKIPKKTRLLLENPNNTLIFSAASLWEISIKRSLNRSDFQLDTRMLRRELIERGYQELSVTSEHAVYTENLAPHHKDPFDRILIAQATVEGITLLTADNMVARYGGSVQKI
jgi:PIN domain nuclease of toxin-antitoxin system